MFENRYRDFIEFSHRLQEIRNWPSGAADRDLAGETKPPGFFGP